MKDKKPPLKSRKPNTHPRPSGDAEKIYALELTELEMQCLANACAAFYNTVGKTHNISPVQTMSIVSAMKKMKDATTGAPKYKVDLVDLAGRSLT